MTAEGGKWVDRIGGALTADPRYRERDWASLAVVATLVPGTTSVTGFTLDSLGKSQPGTPQGDEIDELFEAFQEATRVDGKPPWKSVLVQIVRNRRKVSVEFEYDDAERWQPSPDRIEEMVSAIRPG